ncbi:MULTISPECIES: hypothetical protein [Prauserella salsuginis group]|uniref:Uncharacterized protein n=2 Tax=Prauserella salsuginis group TaxID=2893672 RepID=A0A839XKJ3_9PSEU|nr:MULTISPECIES: hypothetical protein [Prauserella salsuginis group]MBB3662339.1 hypothetical protein [Prauserella sediminis]
MTCPRTALDATSATRAPVVGVPAVVGVTVQRQQPSGIGRSTTAQP